MDARVKKAKMGRPLTDEEKRLGKRVSFGMTASEYEKLRAASEAYKCSISSLSRRLVNAKLSELGPIGAGAGSGSVQ